MFLMSFILVNGRILDYEVYTEELKLMKKIIAADLRSYFNSLGFEQTSDGFYNEDLDLIVTVAAEKQSESEFV